LDLGNRDYSILRDFAIHLTITSDINIDIVVCRSQTITMATTVDQKILKATKFPPEFNQKVDMQKVNLEVMKKFVPQSTILNPQSPCPIYSHPPSRS
jgi:hypothetical protein